MKPLQVGGLPHLDLPKIVLAIGSLGTAAYGVVDVSKGFGGGISNRGFGDIKKVISQFIPASSASGSALSLTSVLATLPRFDLLLTAVLDQGYQRGDQRYRNTAKLVAVPVAILLALLGAWAIAGCGLTRLDALRALAAGLVATPLAPMAKDLASAIQEGTKLAQAWKK